MPDKITEECEHKMEATISVLQREIAGIRTGRASSALLDSIKVDYYGAVTPLAQMATVSTPDAKTLVVQPWDVSQLDSIEKAIQISELGITPARDGKLIRLSIPPMTEDRRKELVKHVKKMGEESKIAIRNVRREGMEKIKKQLKAKELSEDVEKRVEGEIQKVTDAFIRKVDAVLVNKEKEILET